MLRCGIPVLRRTRADDYLCWWCKASQAAAWDHCHEHGYVRGPLCGSRNTREGTSTPYYFLQLEGGTLHLLECRGCLEQRTLPRRFHMDVVRAYLEQTERHGRCQKQPYVREVGHAHGVHRFQLQCNSWQATGKWTREVTVPQAAALVRAFADAALATPAGPPAREPAAGGR
ncbi:endonuclease domain-containing protein [Streptomyces sp. NPDC001009]